MKNIVRVLVVALAFSASTCFVGAQGAQGGRRGFDPEQFRQRMMERFQTQLNVSDAEWTVMQPMIEKVMTKQRETRGGRGAMMFGMRGGPPRGREGEQPGRGQDRGRDRRGPQPPPEVEALQKALESEDTSAADLKSKLAALRESRKKSEVELQKTRNDLRKIVTVRQEAQLVLMGILD